MTIRLIKFRGSYLFYCFQFLVDCFICYGAIPRLITHERGTARLYSIQISPEHRLHLRAKPYLLLCRVIHVVHVILKMNLQCQFGQIPLQTIIRWEKSSFLQCVRHLSRQTALSLWSTLSLKKAQCGIHCWIFWCVRSKQA